jgi:hypothetical protein
MPFPQNMAVEKVQCSRLRSLLELAVRSAWMRDGNWLSRFKKLNPHFWGGCVLVLIFLLYVPALTNYLMGDDFEWLNSVYQGWQRPGQILEKINNFHRPLVKFSYLLNYTLFGTRVFYYNLFTVLLHLANLWLLFLLALRLFGRTLPSVLVVLAFGVSAYYSEVTLWAAGRPDSLMMLFVLGALLLLARHPHAEGGMPPGKHLLLLLLAVGALSAKESWVILPFLALAYLWLLRKIPLKKAFMRIVGLFLLLGLYLAYFVGLPLLRGAAAFTAYGQAGLKMMVNKAALLVYKYLGLGEQYQGDWWQLILLAVLLAAALFSFFRRKNQQALFGLFWMLLGIGVSLPVYYAAARYNYIPLMGFWIMTVAFVNVEYREFAGRHKEKRRIAAILVSLPLIFYLAYQVIMLHWETEDYRLRGRLHEQVAEMYAQIKEKIPPDRPIIFIDLGKRQAVFEMAAAVKGNKKILFVREKAIWQQVFLSPLANFLDRPFSRMMFPVEKNELLPALQGNATTLVFNDHGFAIAAYANYQNKILAYYVQYGELPYKVQVLRIRTMRGKT